MAETIASNTCVLCGQDVRFGVIESSVVKCPRALDGGGHELLPHAFKTGRLDGLCAEQDGVAMCGFHRDDDIHWTVERAEAQLAEGR